MLGAAIGSVAIPSAGYPTRLETRTKESNMCASHGVFTKPKGIMKVNEGRTRSVVERSTTGPSETHCSLGGARAYTLGPERW